MTRVQSPDVNAALEWGWVETRAEAQPNIAQALESRRNRRRGALWGGGIGLVAGGILGGLSAQSDSGDEFGVGLGEAAVAGQAVILGAVLGGGLGALLGATVFAPSVTVDGSHEVRFTPSATIQGVGIRLEVR